MTDDTRQELPPNGIELNLESDVVDVNTNLFRLITDLTNELLLTPDAVIMDSHPLLSEMGETPSNKTIKQAVYKDPRTNTSYLVESGKPELGGESYILIDWLKMGEAKGDLPGGWIKVIQYGNGVPPTITAASEQNLTQQQDILWQSGRARDFYSHMSHNSERKLNDDEIRAIIEQMGAMTIDTELTERTAKYSDFNRAERDFVSTAVDYWHASEGSSVTDTQAAKARFERAESVWDKRREAYTPAVIEYSTDEESAEQPVYAEVTPLTEERIKQVTLDLADIDLRLKAAGEKSIVKDFTFREGEKGYIHVEFTTYEGVTFTLELGDLTIDSNASDYDTLKKHFIGVRSYMASIKETGKTVNMLEPPYLNNKTTIVAVSIEEPDNSSLSEITPADIDNLTDEGVRFFVRKYRALGKYYPAPNVASYPLPLTLIEANIGFHEQTHAEDPRVADLIRIAKIWESRRITDRPRELLKDMSNCIFTTEDYANNGAIEKTKHLTAGMQNQVHIMDNIALMSGLTIRSYLQIHQSNMDPSLLLSKKDVIYGKKSSDVIQLAERANAGIDANNKTYSLLYESSENLEDIISGIINEKSERVKHKPTWTSLAGRFFRSCIKR